MKPRILIIEDNEQNLYLITFILEKHGYQVIQARNGQEGIETAKRDRPTLILLDIQLPGMDGYAVARALRSNASLDQVPIVAVTSYAMAGDRERGVEAGCTGYIEKPINPDTFMAEVEQHLLPVVPTTETPDEADE
ncbi:MAG TPA: response regulator [Chloroflexi bacterium]|nr:response regulator [Chloroflexota bacterium]